MHKILIIFTMFAIFNSNIWGQEVVAYKVQWTGNVQGVGFRAFIKKIAVKNSVTGWVANQQDGSVIANLHGKIESVSMVIQNSMMGPSGSMVKSMNVEMLESISHPDTFKVDD